MTVVSRSISLYECIGADLNDSMSFGIILVTICLLGFWWQKRPKNSAPGPKGLPLIGMAPKLANNPHVTLTEWSKFYGAVMSVRVGRQDWAILNTDEVIKEAFVKQGAAFSSRPPNYFTDHVLSKGRNGIIFNDGSVWKTMKRLTMTAFQKLGCSEKFFENIVNVEARCLLDSMLQHEGEAIDLSPCFLGAAANVISSILCGRRHDCDTSEFTDMCKLMQKFVGCPEETKLANAVIFLPALRYLPVFKSVVSQGYEDSKRLEDYIRSNMLPKQSSSDREDYDCLLDILQSKNYKGNHPEIFTDKNLMFIARDLFLGGIETTTSTLLWCVLALVQDLNLQKELQKEIDTSFRPSGMNYAEHKSRMPLMFSFIHEIHRYCSVAPLGLPHMTNQDVVVGGYEVKKGTTVIVNMWAAHRNPQSFKNPNAFDPYRFINSDGKFSKSLKVVSFSNGSRACLGEKLANVEIFLFLCSMLKHFDINPVDRRKLPSLDDGVFSTAYAPQPFQVVPSRRDCEDT